MSFSNRIQRYDAERGLPRRADEPYLPAYYAFIRCMQDAGQTIVTLCFGVLSAIFLWLASRYFDVGFYAEIIYFALMFMMVLVACAECVRIVRRFCNTSYADLSPYLC